MQNGKAIEIAKDTGKLYQDRKEEAGIRKGFEIGGGQDIIILNKQQLEFLTNYSFDHRLKDSDDEDNEDGNDSLETDISDDDDEEGSWWDWRRNKARIIFKTSIFETNWV